MGKTTSSSSGGKKRLGWMEWLRGWMYVICEMLFQRISASHLQNPLSLPHLHDVTCIITGSTSGIGLQIARSLSLFVSRESHRVDLDFFILFIYLVFCFVVYLNPKASTESAVGLSSSSILLFPPPKVMRNWN